MEFIELVCKPGGSLLPFFTSKKLFKLPYLAVDFLNLLGDLLGLLPLDFELGALEGFNEPRQLHAEVAEPLAKLVNALVELFVLCCLVAVGVENLLNDLVKLLIGEVVLPGDELLTEVIDDHRWDLALQLRQLCVDVSLCNQSGHLHGSHLRKHLVDYRVEVHAVAGEHLDVVLYLRNLKL